MSNSISLPPQQLSFKSKNKSWRKKHLDWAEQNTYLNHELVRKTINQKQINYDLLTGKIHMSDLHAVINPEGLNASYIPESIVHYPLMNSKLNVLIGEESRRLFEYKVIVTNPNSISDIENNKKNEIKQRLEQIVQQKGLDEQTYNEEINKLGDFFSYEWQDMREVRANALINHYMKELNFPLIFNQGFKDALAVGEEIYQCDIVSGEPTLTRINPLKIRIFRSGYSNRIEDADIVILEDYWSPGKVIDTFYNELSKADIKYINELPSAVGSGRVDSMDNIDERFGVVVNSSASFVGDLGEITYDPTTIDSLTSASTLNPYDFEGNLRVIRIYWKSRRKIKKVKSYDEITGEEVYNFYPETYIINEVLGEEEETFFINEAWEGTKIGEKIYINMRPKVVQYNRLSNPSRCHFGIVGSIYNLNDDKPFSLVDMMKPYNYLYDTIHDRLNKLIARNFGKAITIDLAKVPKGWDIDKWMYYLKVAGVAVIDSFKEGTYGPAVGKIAGALNNNTSGVIDGELGNSIQQHINMLDYIKSEISDVVGISKQREGQIDNRETVGGVERATLQSSHITEWLYLIHDDVKKRAIECFLETCKIALQGDSKKFQYILSDSSQRIMDIDGDEFAEADYGLLVDDSRGTQELVQKMDMLAQAALQNQTLNFSTIMKLYNSNSLAEKQHMVEMNEKELMQRQQEQQEQQSQMEQQKMQQDAELAQAQRDHEILLKDKDNETKILIATIAANNNNNDASNESNEFALAEKMREFDDKMQLEREKLEFERDKHKQELDLKEKTLAQQKQKQSNA